MKQRQASIYFTSRYKLNVDLLLPQLQRLFKVASVATFFLKKINVVLVLLLGVAHCRGGKS